MNKEKIKRHLLPLGLLTMSGAYFYTRMDHSAHLLGDFVLGMGLAFVLSAAYFQLRLRSGS